MSSEGDPGGSVPVLALFRHAAGVQSYRKGAHLQLCVCREPRAHLQIHAEW